MNKETPMDMINIEKQNSMK